MPKLNLHLLLVVLGAALSMLFLYLAYDAVKNQEYLMGVGYVGIAGIAFLGFIAFAYKMGVRMEAKAKAQAINKESTTENYPQGPVLSARAVYLRLLNNKLNNPGRLDSSIWNGLLIGFAGRVSHVNGSHVTLKDVDPNDNDCTFECVFGHAGWVDVEALNVGEIAFVYGWLQALDDDRMLVNISNCRSYPVHARIQGW